MWQVSGMSAPVTTLQKRWRKTSHLRSRAAQEATFGARQC